MCFRTDLKTAKLYLAVGNIHTEIVKEGAVIGIPHTLQENSAFHGQVIFKNISSLISTELLDISQM